MRVYIAGTAPHEALVKRVRLPYMMESFLYVKPWQVAYLPKLKGFMLDSGAFTYLMRKKADRATLDRLMGRYIDFVRENRIDDYIELDLDPIVGYPQVKRWRKLLERRVGWPPRIAWHKSRGDANWDAECRDYKNVAIGGIANDMEVTERWHYVVRHLVDRAHERGCIVHGLGVTTRDWVRLIGWDSVDSATWLASGTYGTIMTFDGTGIVQRRARGRGGIRKCRLPRERLLEMAMNTWVDYVHHMDQRRH